MAIPHYLTREKLPPKYLSIQSPIQNAVSAQLYYTKSPTISPILTSQSLLAAVHCSFEINIPAQLSCLPLTLALIKITDKSTPESQFNQSSNPSQNSRPIYPAKPIR